MELSKLIDALSLPKSYSFPVQRIEVHQTHISAVFLAGEFAYKIKKPVELGFLDFSTLEKRKHFCEEEVRLNRRLAPGVYLGVVPIALHKDCILVEGSGPVVEWAVKMQRLPEDATLQRRLGRGEVSEESLVQLAQRLTEFHATAATNEYIASFGSIDVVAGNIRENFQQSENQVGVAISQRVWNRLIALTEASLQELQPLIEQRARRGVPRDTHGDLHLDHVYLFADKAPPDDLVIVDCIEFNERFRFADPIADMAFLVMDLRFHHRPDLAEVFANAYFEKSKDDEGRKLLPLYSSYRAAVRGKVECMKRAESEVPDKEKRVILESSRAHWLLAMAQLSPPKERPCLLLVGGLPGTGKSTIARAIAEHAGMEVIRSDAIRKELAGIRSDEKGDGKIYTPEFTEQTYAECLRRADQMLFDGQRVIVDATFRDDALRQRFIALAHKWRVPVLFLHCHAEPHIVRERLQQRKADVSDADWSVYQALADAYHDVSEITRPHRRRIRTSSTLDDALLQVVQELVTAGLLPSASSVDTAGK